MKPITLISMQEYEMVCGLKCRYDGYVWSPEGKIFSVQTLTEIARSPRPSYPYGNHLGYTKYDSFYETYHKVTITLVDIGDNCVLYDEEGNFVRVLQRGEANEKGQIKILKYNPAYRFNPQHKWNDEMPGEEEYDCVNIQDITLNIETYSRIFTHIVSFMMRENLKTVRNEQISVELYERGYGAPKFYNLEPNSYPMYYLAEAYHNPDQDAIVALVDRKDTLNKNLYSTFWNILNMLGAHELNGHRIIGWGGDSSFQHHLVYHYQMVHPSWERTTQFFKEKHLKKLNDFYDSYRREITNEKIQQGKREGLMPKSFDPKDVEIFKRQIEQRIQYWYPIKVVE